MELSHLSNLVVTFSKGVSAFSSILSMFSTSVITFTSPILKATPLPYRLVNEIGVFS